MPILPQDDNRNDIHPVSINMNTAIQVRCQGNANNASLAPSSSIIILPH